MINILELICIKIGEIAEDTIDPINLLIQKMGIYPPQINNLWLGHYFSFKSLHL